MKIAPSDGSRIPERVLRQALGYYLISASEIVVEMVVLIDEGHAIGLLKRLERLEDQNQHTTCEVGEAALEGQTDRQAGGTDNGHE